jgi:hypothetical protein
MDNVKVEVFLIILNSFMPNDGAIGTDRTNDHFMSTRRPKGGLAHSREASIFNIVTVIHANFLTFEQGVTYNQFGDLDSWTFTMECAFICNLHFPLGTRLFTYIG